MLLLLEDPLYSPHLSFLIVFIYKVLTFDHFIVSLVTYDPL